MDPRLYATSYPSFLSLRTLVRSRRTVLVRSCVLKSSSQVRPHLLFPGDGASGSARVWRRRKHTTAWGPQGASILAAWIWRGPTHDIPSGLGFRRRSDWPDAGRPSTQDLRRSTLQVMAKYLTDSRDALDSCQDDLLSKKAGRPAGDEVLGAGRRAATGRVSSSTPLSIKKTRSARSA